MGTPITIEAILLYQILKGIEKMNASVERLTREVAESRTATESALALIAGLSEQIRNSIGNDTALETLADDLDSQQASLAEAVTANTAAEPVADAEPGEATPTEEAPVSDATFPDEAGSASSDVGTTDTGSASSDVGTADSGGTESGTVDEASGLGGTTSSEDTPSS